jgi:hypothetical protein
MKKNALIFLTILSLLLLAMIPSVPDEGMFPLSEISNLDLNSAGLKISVDEVYNPRGVSLVDALVKIGGCTGSFVSPEGLIITNHHCSFGAVQKASTTKNNYLENGFLAETREEEIPAEGFTCRITVSYKDVSSEILEAANQVDDITERIKVIRKEIKRIVKDEEEKDSTITAEVSEMFIGQSYVLFRYKTIKDVRLVYVPPLSIGDFGGESDNWIWPRHTGDFSFLRAYVAPDGSSADYSEENVPFTPKKYLEVNPNGVNEEDFVFLLGYPGRTFKHQPSQFLKFQMEYQLPYISKLYRWMIDIYEEKGEDDPEFALKISSRIKSLANVEKNYKGKMQGFKRLNLIEKKKEEENRLQEFINADLELKEKYGNVMNDIDEVYNEIYSEGRLSLILIMMNRYSTLYRLAYLLLDYHNELAKPEDDRGSLYTEKRRKDLQKQIDNMFKDYNPELDKKILKKIIRDAQTFPETQSVNAFAEFENAEELNEKIDEMYDDTELMDIEEYIALLFGPTEDVNDLDDHTILFAMDFYELDEEIENKRDARSGKLNILLAKFMEVKKLFLDKNFIPDANHTLRLTYGYVRGYEPADAIYYSPISTLKGVIEKGEDDGDYMLLPVIRELYEDKDFGSFKDEKLDDVPVAILYNTDTSGGNSGSPILDAHGRLVGVNFDRPIEATINDFVWSEEYSRSIGVDIRYVLWITQKVGHADFLLREINVETE